MKSFIQVILLLVLVVSKPTNSQQLFRGYTAPDSSVYLYVAIHSFVPFENYFLHRHVIYSVDDASFEEFHRTYPSSFGAGNFTFRSLEDFNFIGGTAPDCFVSAVESGESNFVQFYNAFSRYNNNYGAIGIAHNIQISQLNKNFAVFNTYATSEPRVSLTTNGLATFTTNPNFNNIYIAGINPKTGTVYGINSDGVFQSSTDSCNSFTPLGYTKQYSYPLITYDRADSIFYTYGIKLYSNLFQAPMVTKNNGAYWASIQQGVYQISAGHISGRLYGLINNRFQKSDNYGATFTPVQGSNNIYTSLYANPYKEEVYLWQGDSAIVKWNGTSFTTLIGTITAIEKEITTESFTISNPYPNPSDGYCTIKINSLENVSYRIDFFNLLGEMVAPQQTGELIKGVNQLKLELGNLPKGIYLCRIKGGNNFKVVKIVID